MLKRKEVCSLVGLCYTTIYTLEKQGKFPRRRKLSPGRVGWVKQEVRDWLHNLDNVKSVFLALGLLC